MSSCGRHHGGARWKTSCAILHGVEFWFGTPVGNYGKLPHTIRRHSRGKPALPDASERLSERLPGRLCPFLYVQSPDLRFGAVAQFFFIADSNYGGERRTAGIGFGSVVIVQHNFSRVR